MTIDRYLADGRFKKGKILSPSFCHGGYRYLPIQSCGIKKGNKIARLVAINFLGEKPAPMQVNHIDGNKLNDDVSNLEWVTPSENQIHSSHVLGNQIGEKSHNSKLSNSDASNIRALHKNGHSLAGLAGSYRVHKGTIHKIVEEKTYRTSYLGIIPKRKAT